ncbi:hypothetical protein AGOR_G00175290 [Albula goreensis]|uniref:Telomeric repeat-binding factor n=1 Tax=Albula goreensis TaxID=1534307 RepID=A0A8T3CZF7_9TELE|nr:hypothetical protein AGOR_G00175290 [Albula goreensis]
MESDTPEECGTTRNTDGSVAFSEVEKVARRWMIDFLFISVCRLFKEEKYLEFTQSLKSLEAMIEGSQKIGKDEKTKIELCGFLSRIVNGKKLAVQFEHNKQVTPLMSALSIWESISDVLIDKDTYEKIKNLLFIQSIGVCLQQGSDTMASWVLKWLMDECQITENLKMKLSVIVNKKDAYHPFLVQFSFNHLVESVKAFLDSFLEVHPSDFLLTAASKVVLTCQEAGMEESKEDQDVSESDILNGEGLKRQKKKRLLPNHASLWKPESSKKPSGKVLGGNSDIRVIHSIRWSTPLKNLKILASSENTVRTRKEKTKWLFEEDKNLRRGVLRHGEGKWSKILQEFDFQSRTAVMLKDRWRTLKKKQEKAEERILPNDASLWKPLSCKKPSGETIGRNSGIRVTSSTTFSSESTVTTRKERTKWLFEEDKNLRRGVLRHGEGKWSKILQEFDFQNRTAVMLKDRWRTLKKKREKVARPHELPT